MFAFCFSALAQAADGPPVIGDLGDIKGMTRIYIVADAEPRKHLGIELTKKGSPFEIVADPERAQVFVEYRVMDRRTVTSLDMLLEQGQLDVYIYREGRKVLAWSETKSAGYPARALVKEFLKDARKYAKR